MFSPSKIKETGAFTAVLKLVIRSPTRRRDVNVLLYGFIDNNPVCDPSPLMVAWIDCELLVIDSVTSHPLLLPLKVKLPPYCSSNVEVEPDGSTTSHEECGEGQDSSPEIRWRQSAHADLRLQDVRPVGEVLQEEMFAGPSIREWTFIIPSVDDVTDLSCDDSTNDGTAQLTSGGADKCSAVFPAR